MIEHEMLLLDADFKVVARMVGRMKKDCRISTEASTSDSYSENSSSSLESGSTCEESE